MSDQYGSDFITITDEDGVKYELEILSTLEFNGANYLAAIPASEDLNPEVLILKSVEEDGESILYTIDDEEELNIVNELIMESLFHDSELE